MKAQYNITGQGGQRQTATSLKKAKRIAKGMCIRNVGRYSNMSVSGTFLNGPRLYWTEWADGTIIGDPTRGYSVDNPMVSIRKA